MMSTWRTVAPPSTAAWASAPRRAKSAERIEAASSIIRMLPVSRVSSCGPGATGYCLHDLLGHAIHDSFCAYSADRPGVSLALHHGQPSNAPNEHCRGRHRSRIVQRHRERIALHKFTKLVLRHGRLFIRWGGGDASDNLKEILAVESPP